MTPIKPAIKKKISVTPKKNKLSSAKGAKDILPDECRVLDSLHSAAANIAGFYNFSRIEPAPLESSEIEDADWETLGIDPKRILTIKGSNGDLLSLRFDPAISLLRSFTENGLHKTGPQRLYYFTPSFKDVGEEAAYKTEYHIGFGILGGNVDSIYDAQVINTVYRLLGRLKLKDLMIHINSVGCMVCRPNYKKRLLQYFKDLSCCKECKRKLEKNPFRIFDCGDKECIALCANAPIFLDSLCSNCSNHLKNTLEFLEELKLPYMVVPQFIGDLDYRSRTVFKVVSEGSGDLAWGGRHDYLGEIINGHTIPAVQSRLNVEKLIELMRETSTASGKGRIFLIYVGDLAKRKSLPLIEEFREKRLPVTESLGEDSLSAQLQAASQLEAPVALILGQKEAHEENIIVRDMETGIQEIVPISKVVEEVRKRLRSN
ncbi:MAG: ATP phosphoribosyltransferase regulatory subunit [Candidatus Colwellbacteria bacterium]|nr:ATP phosphoribosyltransferase regulatory subunit [Candidatus Colwellbacteria bacterium]